MRKIYSKPTLELETFSVADVIMQSGSEFFVEDFY